MAKFLIEIPDEQAAVLVAAFAHCYGYQQNDNETPNEHWTRRTREYWQSKLDQYNADQVEEAAAAARVAAWESRPKFEVELTAIAVQ